MSILSDREIIERCATTTPMISPFCMEQVRQTKAPHEGDLFQDGTKRVISYGLSSYGYDVRCADEFKVFTNINNTIVDPKNFDERSFVEVSGDGYCIIPPNSFALGRTVEHFNIPRDVLTICLGKSTYARCFTGDTRVALANGTSASFIELIERSKNGERFWGYSVSDDGKIKIAELTTPRKIGHEKVIEVTLDNNQKIRCTPDHKFMLKDGSYCEAKDLVGGSSLMPLYRVRARGYESVTQPGNYDITPTHRLADEWNIRHGVYSPLDNEHRHHVDQNRLNNFPNNIKRMSGSEHLKFHNEEQKQLPGYYEKCSVRAKEFFQRKQKDPVWMENFRANARKASQGFWRNEKYSLIREKLIADRKERGKNLTIEQREAISERMRVRWLDLKLRAETGIRLAKLWNDPEFRRVQREAAHFSNLRKDIDEAEVRQALEKAGNIRGAARILKCDRSVFRRFQNIILEYKDRWLSERLNDCDILNALKETGSIRAAASLLGIGRKKLLSYKEAVSSFYGTTVAENHKVVEVRTIEETHDVYCLTVPEFGNFALESGVFVKNCGVVINVTPLEPEWSGYVTLEFSNTTPLPAKIYANEGIAQFLFFKGEYECMTSYKDRGGKYQNQTGVTIPRL